MLFIISHIPQTAALTFDDKALKYTYRGKVGW